MPVVVRRRVDFPMLDLAGIAYYPRIYDLAHRAFEELWLPVTGEDYSHWLRERRLGFPVVHIESDFHGPFRYGDEAVCEVWVERVGRTSVTFGYRFSTSEGALVWTSRQVCACVDMARLTPQVVPDDLRPRLESCGPPEDATVGGVPSSQMTGGA